MLDFQIFAARNLDGIYSSKTFKKYMSRQGIEPETWQIAKNYQMIQGVDH